MWRGVKDNAPKRGVWACETADLIKANLAQIKELTLKNEQVRLLCNHTYKNGNSAITRSYDDHDDTWNDVCEVCEKR